MKNSFLLYNDQREIFESLSGDECKELIMAIYDFPNYTIVSPLVKIAFVSIKNQLQRDYEKWETIREKRSEYGKKGNEKRWKDKKKIANIAKAIPLSQTIANIAVNVNVNVINIYNIYKQLINKNSILTDKAKVKIKTRLKNYTEQDLLKAMENFSKNAWRMENNADKGIAWFFDNDDRIDQFMNMKNESTNTVNNLLKGTVNYADLK